MRPQHTVRVHEVYSDRALSVVLPCRPLAPNYKRAFRVKHQEFGQLRRATDNYHLKLGIIWIWIPKNELTESSDFTEHLLPSCFIVDLHVQVTREVEGDTTPASEHVEYIPEHGPTCYEEPSRPAPASSQPLEDDYLSPFRREPASEGLVVPELPRHRRLHCRWHLNKSTSEADTSRALRGS